MKTEKQIKIALKEHETRLKEAQTRFGKYDNHEDLEEIACLKEAIQHLKWFLN